ncbi:MAG: gamma-glutamylcyclotransferase [Pseudomonadota bacterium]
MSASDAAEQGFWVFGYGSLMWKPGFEFVERRLARLDGYRRRFALSSTRYRGSPEEPGLLLGLDWAPGQSCLGAAFRISPAMADETRAYLAERELVTRSYFEISTPVTLICDGPGQGARFDAICYVLDRTHPQYAGDLALEDQIHRIRSAAGPMGLCREYFDNTVAHLAELGIEEPEIAALAEALKSTPPQD